MLFSILGVASQDKLINEEGTNDFNTIILPESPNEEIRKAFKTKDFNNLGKELSNYCRKINTILGLELESCSSDPVKDNDVIGSDDDIPVGSVIAYSSYRIPKGYLKCDGSWYSKAQYQELYEVLKGQGHCRENGDKFQIFNMADLFVRGTFDKSKIGVTTEDTTRMPRNLFKIQLSGAHIHNLIANGEHQHISDVSGQHKHKVLPGGNHTHQMTPSGGHKHTAEFAGAHQHVIENAGNHKHFLEAAGEHNHNADNYKYLLKLNECGTVRTAGDCDQHDISFENSHTHNIHFSTHQHDLDEGGLHSHTIQSAGSHTHEIKESEKHTHEIAGGDDETSPKNIQLVYLIKAKPTEIIKLAKELQKRVDALEKGLKKNSDQSQGSASQTQGILTTMLTTITTIGLTALIRKRFC